MQGSGETFSWFRVAERVVAGLAVSTIVGVGSYILTRVARKRLARGTVVRGPIHAAGWSRYLRWSPVAIAIGAAVLIFTYCLLAPYFFVGLSRGWEWYVPYGTVLGVLLALSGLRELYSSAVLFKEACFQNMYELFAVLHERVVDILRRGSGPVELERVVRCNIMMYNPDTKLLEMRFWHNFDRPEDIDRGRSLPVQKGVAGRAFVERRERLGMLGEISRPLGGTDAWGFTNEDWEQTRHDLEWVWSIPLMRAGREFPIAILNIDSNCTIDLATAARIGDMALDLAPAFAVACANYGPA